MNNLEIYKKTLGFSLRRIFWEFLSPFPPSVASSCGHCCIPPSSSPSC